MNLFLSIPFPVSKICNVLFLLYQELYLYEMISLNLFDVESVNELNLILSRASELFEINFLKKYLYYYKMYL